MKTLSMAGETSWQERIIDLHTIWIPVFLNLQQLTHQVQMHNNDVLVIQNAFLTTLVRTDPSKSGSIMHLYMLFCSFPLWNWSYLYTSGARNGYVLNFLLVEWKSVKLFLYDQNIIVVHLHMILPLFEGSVLTKVVKIAFWLVKSYNFTS